MGDRLKLCWWYIQNISKPYVDALTGYKPTDQSINNVKEILKTRTKHGRELSDDELSYRVNEILDSAIKFTPKTQLPSFKMTDLTIGAKTPDVRKNFVQC